MGRFTICPYYIDENKRSISCEDVCRTYCSVEDKIGWMKMYCDTWDWMKCPYAADRSEAYARKEKGDDTALDEQEKKALDKENKYLRTLLGKADKRIERQQKKIDELMGVNQSFTAVNQNLEKQKKDYYGRWRKAQAALDKGDEKIRQDLAKLGIIYEQRMAYLIDMYAPGKVIYEDDIEDWAKDRAFALVHQYEEGRLLWMVKFEEKTHDGKSDNLQTEEQK